MFIKRRRGWEIAERLVTPEAVALSRRAAVGLAGAGLIAAGPAQAPRGRIQRGWMLSAQNSHTTWATIARPISLLNCCSRALKRSVWLAR